mgnify:CR=1 FL=1
MCIRDRHYGYWTDDMEVDVSNFVKAQEKYTEFLIENIPREVKRILDVGGGAGMTTGRLTDKGFKVDCLTPSPDLANEARAKLGSGVEVFECKFEELETEKRYDLVLFSESFQYIPVKFSIPKALKYLNPGGYILICDFFKTDAPGKSALSGGHNLQKFYNTIAGFPVLKLKDIDITEKTAPNMKIVDSFINQVAKPLWEIAFKFFDMNYPFTFNLLKKFNKKKIKKTEDKFFAGRLNPEEFKKYKSYRLMLFKKDK